MKDELGELGDQDQLNDLLMNIQYELSKWAFKMNIQDEQSRWTVKMNSQDEQSRWTF